MLFAITFAFLGVGSGANGGLDQLFSGLNIFASGGNSGLEGAEGDQESSERRRRAIRDLATAYEAKGDTANAITALQQYTSMKPKDAAAWSELGGLQLSQAQDYLTQYQAAYQNRQLAAPSQRSCRPGKLGTALGTNQIEQAAASQVDAAVQDLQQRTQLAYNDARRPRTSR